MFIKIQFFNNFYFHKFLEIQISVSEANMLICFYTQEKTGFCLVNFYSIVPKTLKKLFYWQFLVIHNVWSMFLSVGGVIVSVTCYIYFNKNMSLKQISRRIDIDPWGTPHLIRNHSLYELPKGKELLVEETFAEFIFAIQYTKNIVFRGINFCESCPFFLCFLWKL